MDQATFAAVIALGTAIATGAGVKLFDFLIAIRRGRDGLNEKQFDDGVLRRQEMIKEIDYLRSVIANKDKEIATYQTQIEGLRREFFDLSISYTKLQGDYRDVVEKLEELKQGFIKTVDQKKAEIQASDALAARPPIVPPPLSTESKH